MSTNKIPVIKFLFRSELPALKEALNINPTFEVEDVESPNDLATYLSTIPAGLVITSLKDKNDLIQLATFQKIAKKVAKDTAVKVVVFNFSGDRSFEKAIAKLGIQDLVEPGVNTKALKFKLDFWMKALNVQLKNSPNAATQNDVKKLDASKQADTKKAEGLTPNWGPALDLEDDIWILKNDSDCKKILSKWLIRMMGPSPYIGQWVELKANLWRFDIKESEKEMYVPSKGAWYFSGDVKPDFVWKENIWLMTGDSFELFFKDENQILSRLKSKDKLLTIANNSIYAKTKEPMIIESFDKELVFKREAEKLEDLEGKNKTDQLNGGPLSGKNKTDQLDGGPLSGKNKTPADKSGNLTGKTEGEAPIVNENLKQKTSTARESKFWNGKNEYQQETGTADFGVKTDAHKSGTQLELERNDQDHQRHYKNYNEAKQYDAVPEKEREAREKEAASGNLSGKSSTDELPSHYDNSKTREKEGPKGKEQDLAGKSETDKLKSHYGQKEGAEGVKEGKGKDLAGKSETDQIDTHYGKAKNDAVKNNSRPEKEEQADMAAAREQARKEKEKIEARERELEKKEQEQKATRKNEVSEREEQSSKTRMDNGIQETADDYETNSQGATDKIAGHYKGKSDQKENKKQREDDPFADFFEDTKERKDSEREEKRRGARAGHESMEGEADVVELAKAREERAKSAQQLAEEKELSELTKNAKIDAYMIHKGRKVACNVDDFFEETLVLTTTNAGIENSATVGLDMNFNFLEKDTKLKMEGQVISVDDDGEGNHYVTVQVSQAYASTFDVFMKLYQQRQNNVNEFLKRAKGL